MHASIKPSATLSARHLEALFERALDLAISEDLGPEPKDVTTDALVSEAAHASGHLYCKQPGVISGLSVAAKVFERFDRLIEVVQLVPDGAVITAEQPVAIAAITGLANPILKAERLALNLMQRMSGIATFTHGFVSKAAPLSIEILDTRKTTPGLRVFEREAVRAGGGTNHRFGLFDAILIKDNHVRLAGGVLQAIQAARSASPRDMQIEVEVTSFDEVQQAIEGRANRIMLDNMTPDMVQTAVEMIAGKAYIEVSGGINLSNIDRYLIRGVNGISIGALTHSAPSLDISLEVETIES